jgi:hypothetical protein
MRLRRKGAEGRRCTRLIVLVKDGVMVSICAVICGWSFHSVLIEGSKSSRTVSVSVVYSDSVYQ